MATTPPPSIDNSDGAALEDRPHARPRDYHNLHIWLVEPPIRHGVLTADGMTQIAQHKYVGGSYTHLDAWLSPNLWQPLTDALPLWLAPNLVTTFGGCFCFVSFCLANYYLPNDVPNWLFVSNAFCMMAYYTLDCMDGKQARRTQSSSPLGQLFDHGMDCICNLSHLQLVQCIVQVEPHLLVIVQCSLQFAFWQAQWEEYYTGILPHATGKWCGVTEVNYGLAVWSLVTGLVGRDVYEQAVPLPASWDLPLGWLTEPGDELQVRHVALVGWMTMIVGLVSLSWGRVYRKVQNPRIFASAMSKFLSPLALCGVSIWGLTETAAHGAAAAGSLSLGLCFCLITIKIIVYSMAKMGYASWQVDILPYLSLVVLCRLFEISNAVTLFHAMDVLYLLRLLYWVYEAIQQLCERLGIQLFRISVKEA